MPTSQRLTVPGPAGAIECVIDTPDAPHRGIAVVCHPHPLQGGTLDNKVAATLARAFVQLGYRAVRLNFRGVGKSEGQWDEGRGEVDDTLAVIAAYREPALPLALAGFSFGGFVASQAAASLPEGERAVGLVLIAPSTLKQNVPPVPEDTLVVHGESDDVVPLSATLDWARPQALPVVVVPGAGHFFHGQLTLLKNLVVRGFHH